jgi:hypothetical protein
MVSAELVKKMRLSSVGDFFSFTYQTTGLSKGFNDGGTGVWSCVSIVADLTSGLVLELCGPEDEGDSGGVELGDVVPGSFAKLSLSSNICESAFPAPALPFNGRSMSFSVLRGMAGSAASSFIPAFFRLSFK